MANAQSTEKYVHISWNYLWKNILRKL